ncbi:MAG: hypothetical protein NC548_52450 [Lachnospiraceae bacterium]|nr:hypothetical protein [Lachnospiraceae bacterium]
MMSQKRADRESLEVENYMERNIFVREFGVASTSLDKRKIKKLVKKSVNANQDGNPRGHHNLIIVMEELSELSKEVSKQIRGRGDIVSLTEEMADVSLGLIYLQEICGITTEDIYKAINVKVDRLERVLNKKGCYL